MLHDLSREPLLDLLLELALEPADMEIVIAGEHGPARLSLSRGRLIHAECKDARGPAALEKILQYESGQCEVLSALRTADRSLDVPLSAEVLGKFQRGGAKAPPNVLIGAKTLVQFPSLLPREVDKPTKASPSSSRPPPAFAERGKLTHTGYSSVPPAAFAEERLDGSNGLRTTRSGHGHGSRHFAEPVRHKSSPNRQPIVSALTASAQRVLPAVEEHAFEDHTIEVDETALEPDTGPVPSSKLDRTSLVRLEELHEAISSARNPIPLRDEEEPAEPPHEDESASSSEPSLPRVGRYEVLARLKSGGMGSIYLCRLSGSAGFQRLFAMKVLHQHLTEQQDALDLFFSEARLLAQLHHPNIVGIVDVGSVDQPYLVLDYVEGGSLNELFKASARTLDPGIVLSVALDALQGLSAAHQLQGEDGQALGLVHNDISPHNLLIGIDGTCRVTDFGVAKTEYDHVSSSPTTRGKPSYIAPERLAKRSCDQRADLFSMGVVLYQGLTGIDPFLGATQEETLRNVLERTPPLPSEVGLRPPPTLDWICMKALAKDPSERFQSAEEMARHLRRAAAREDLLVAPNTVANWVRTAMAGPLEARRAAAQKGALSEEGRRRGSTRPPPPVAAAPHEAPAPFGARPPSDPPLKSSDFNEKTEILSVAPASSQTRVRNIILYAALGLTVAALVLVLFFPEKVQHFLVKQAAPHASSDEAWQRDSASSVAPAPAGSGAPGAEANPADAEPAVHIAPVTRDGAAREGQP